MTTHGSRDEKRNKEKPFILCVAQKIINSLCQTLLFFYIIHNSNISTELEISTMYNEWYGINILKVIRF